MSEEALGGDCRQELNRVRDGSSKYFSACFEFALIHFLIFSYIDKICVDKSEA